MHSLRRSARVFYMQVDPEDNRDIALPSFLQVWPACPARLPACLPACTVDMYHGCRYMSQEERLNASLHYDGYWGPEKRGTVRHLFY